MIVYISRGLMSSLTEAREVLDNIAVENGHMGHKVIINTYAVIDGMSNACCLEMFTS